jgi:hypothetical protein
MIQANFPWKTIYK